MNGQHLLEGLVAFINQQGEETDAQMRELRKKEPLIESMQFLERLNYLHAVAEAKGRIDLLTKMKKQYDYLNSNG